MSDKVFPSSKPTANGGGGGGGGGAAITAAANGTTATKPPPASNKSHLYNPTARPPYRPQPHNRYRHRRSGRSICCCFCFWAILITLILLLLVATAAAALYIIYRPHPPAFSIPSLRIHRFNLTTAADASSSHLSSLFNLTITAKNPNSHISFDYEPFTLTSFAGDVLAGNGTLPAFGAGKKNETSFRNVVVVGSNDLDADSVNALRSDLKKKNGGGEVAVKIQLDTKVSVKVGKFATKKVGMRTTCEGIKGAVPKGKSPTVAVTSGAKCKVDLRVKIWKFTF